MEIASGWNPLVISTNNSLSLRCLTRIQVRKIGDGTDNKGTSKLTQEVLSEIGQTSRTEIFPKQLTTEICKPFRKNLHRSCLSGFWIRLWTHSSWVKQRQRNWGAMFVWRRSVLFYKVKIVILFSKTSCCGNHC